MRKMLAVIFGAFICAVSGVALATVGQAPLPGVENYLPDGQWLNGVAGGQNYLYLNSVTAAGTNHATSYQLPAGYALVEVDTTASGTGVALQTCQQGVSLSLYNKGANTLTIYPSIVNNPATGAQDTINNATSMTLASNASAKLSCAKNGVWTATPGMNQTVTGKFKIADQGSCTMASGTCAAQTLASTYTTAPACFVTWNGTGTLTGILKAPSTTNSVTPASSVGTDTAVVNWICFGQ